MVDISKQNAEALEWILDYDNMRKRYIEQSAAFSEIAATAYTGMPHGSGISRPCENKGITLAELDKLKLKIMSVEKMEQTLSEKRKVFLEFRRRAEQVEKGVGRPPWADYVQVRYANWHEARHGRHILLHRNTLRSWMDDIVEVTVRIAIKLGAM